MTFILILLLALNFILLTLNIVLRKHAEKNLNDAEYKRWQVIHHRYVQKEIEEGKERLTLLHPFIREHGGCKGNKNIWYN